MLQTRGGRGQVGDSRTQGPCAGKEADRGPPGCMVQKRFAMAPWPQGSGVSTPLAPVADGGAGTGSLPGEAGWWTRFSEAEGSEAHPAGPPHCAGRGQHRGPFPPTVSGQVDQHPSALLEGQLLKGGLSSLEGLLAQNAKPQGQPVLTRGSDGQRGQRHEAGPDTAEPGGPGSRRGLRLWWGSSPRSSTRGRPGETDRRVCHPEIAQTCVPIHTSSTNVRGPWALCGLWPQEEKDLTGFPPSNTQAPVTRDSRYSVGV